eukprot:GHVU01065885.1.p1 GENE.GHVU01065885.1~~GHVU01065885.1.p1  ORF type:complete len:118 (-),score=10.54 GHVU01065885.1:198-551(-)
MRTHGGGTIDRSHLSALERNAVSPVLMWVSLSLSLYTCISCVCIVSRLNSQLLFIGRPPMNVRRRATRETAAASIQSTGRHTRSKYPIIVVQTPLRDLEEEEEKHPVVLPWKLQGYR